MELLKRDWVLPDVNSQCLLTYLSVILFEKYLLIWLYWILGEGNGTPLQYSCLENPMDGGTWWAAVRGVGKSGT